jgi:hypothetical protein
LFYLLMVGKQAGDLMMAMGDVVRVTPWRPL